MWRVVSFWCLSFERSFHGFQPHPHEKLWNLVVNQDRFKDVPFLCLRGLFVKTVLKCV
jgi:hypothetical protein